MADERARSRGRGRWRGRKGRKGEEGEREAGAAHGVVVVESTSERGVEGEEVGYKG